LGIARQSGGSALIWSRSYASLSGGIIRKSYGIMITY
jgi:hypothetical protein